MIARLKAELRALRAEVRRLQPVSGPGVLTSKGSRGVSRRPLVTGAGRRQTTDTVPRFG